MKYIVYILLFQFFLMSVLNEKKCKTPTFVLKNTKM